MDRCPCQRRSWDKTLRKRIGVVFSRIETVLLLELATARSSLASPWKSRTASEKGPLPVPKSVLGQNTPEANWCGVQQNRDGVAIRISHRQIELAIAIEIPHRD